MMAGFDGLRGATRTGPVSRGRVWRPLDPGGDVHRDVGVAGERPERVAPGARFRLVTAEEHADDRLLRLPPHLGAHAMRLLTRADRLSAAPPVMPVPGPDPVTVGSGPSILLTQDGWVVGHVVDVPGRLTDVLAARDTIGLMTSDGYREFDRDDVLALVPPPAPARNELRIAKRQMPVTVDLGGLVTVTGNCHLLPGATVWDAWQRSTSGFAALTDARVRFPDGSVETADVVLVSRHAAATGLQRD